MVQPLTPPTVAPTAAAGHWYEPTPDHGTAARPAEVVVGRPGDRRSEHKRIRFELLAMLVLIAVPSFLIGLDGIADPTSIDVSDISLLELLASLAGAVGAGRSWPPSCCGATSGSRAAGYNRRSPRFIARLRRPRLRLLLRRAHRGRADRRRSSSRGLGGGRPNSERRTPTST